MDDVFKPIVACFDLAGHVGELETNNGMVDETLAECFSLVGVFDRFFIADAREPDALDDDADAFVVEVCHDH